MVVAGSVLLRQAEAVKHLHVIPVPEGMTPEQAWDELVAVGEFLFPLTDPDTVRWATIECDGETCEGVE